MRSLKNSSTLKWQLCIFVLTYVHHCWYYIMTCTACINMHCIFLTVHHCKISLIQQLNPNFSITERPCTKQVYWLQRNDNAFRTWCTVGIFLLQTWQLYGDMYVCLLLCIWCMLNVWTVIMQAQQHAFGCLCTLLCKVILGEPVLVKLHMVIKMWLCKHKFNECYVHQK